MNPLDNLVWIEKYYPIWRPSTDEIPVTYQTLATLGLASSMITYMTNRVSWFTVGGSFDVSKLDVVLTSVKVNDRFVVMASELTMFLPYKKAFIGLLDRDHVDRVNLAGIFYQMTWPLASKAWILECDSNGWWSIPAGINIRTAGMSELLPSLANCLTAVRLNNKVSSSPEIAWLLGRGDELARDAGLRWLPRAKRYTI